MDPESAAFQPRDDLWRIQDDMFRVHQTQADLSERVSRLERRNEEDLRLKNVWRTSSPFPSVLGVPLQQPTADRFSNFDDHSTSLINDLQLDADDEPRRIGTTSRANSVRFDETANHGHWSRPSMEFIPRTGSGMGGHPMSERSYSHKSLGGQSSAGQSVHSATSGRANSFTSYGLNNVSDAPGLAPGLFILGAVPAIIRCWLTTIFKHDTMLYAAVCSGSYASYLDFRLIHRLGFQDQIIRSDDDRRTIRLPMYLPEAVPVSASSHASSPAPQLPSLTVEFTVVENRNDEADNKAIQIFLGSDMLRAHNADILLSSNQVTLYDDDRSKLRIPLVRPEDELTFKSLYITSGPHNHAQSQPDTEKPATMISNAARLEESSDPSSVGLQHTSVRSQKMRKNQARPAPRRVQAHRLFGAPATGDVTQRKPGLRIGPTWGNPPVSTYQRRDTGIKVLKKPGVRTLSTSMSHNSSSSMTGQSRFFDDGKRREDAPAESEGSVPPFKRSASGEKPKENIPSLVKTRSANPVGGASAFPWLTGGSK
ncbi:hypothetical protein N0V90_007796 [Kalmusia sp. IMI 367209]|nr:hypothetical protein N0V90_007796 [Kalmusia sp. IMI 367209]